MDCRRLSLNLGREEQRREAGPRTETLHVKAMRGGGRGGGGYHGGWQLRGGGGGGPEARLETTEVSLSSELYLAPEMMYASLDLVGMIVEAAQDLPAQYLKDCFSHILIQGEKILPTHVADRCRFKDRDVEVLRSLRTLFTEKPPCRSLRDFKR